VADTAPRPFRPADLDRERQITSFALSPDGSHVVYARREIVSGEYRSHLRLTGVRGGWSRTLTTHGRESRPTFSPDGSQILFLSERDNTSRAWVLPRSGGEPSERISAAGSFAGMIGSGSSAGGTCRHNARGAAPPLRAPPPPPRRLPPRRRGPLMLRLLP